MTTLRHTATADARLVGSCPGTQERVAEEPLAFRRFVEKSRRDERGAEDVRRDAEPRMPFPPAQFAHGTDEGEVPTAHVPVDLVCLEKAYNCDAAVFIARRSVQGFDHTVEAGQGWPKTSGTCARRSSSRKKDPATRDIRSMSRRRVLLGLPSSCAGP